MYLCWHVFSRSLAQSISFDSDGTAFRGGGGWDCTWSPPPTLQPTFSDPSIRQSRFSESVLLLHHFLTKSTSDPRVSAQALEFSSAALLKHACAHKSPGGLIKMQMVMLEMWRSRFLKAPRCCCCYLSTRIWWCFFSCERSLQSRVIIFWSSLFLTDWYGLIWIIIIINTNRIFGL